MEREQLQRVKIGNGGAVIWPREARGTQPGQFYAFPGEVLDARAAQERKGPRK